MLFRKLTLVCLGCLALFAAFKNNPGKKAGGNQTASLNKFLDSVFDANLLRHPMQATYLGEKINYGKWDDVSDKAAQENFAFDMAMLQKMRKNFDTLSLDKQGLISYKLFELNAKYEMEAFPYRFNNYPVNQEDGLHTEVPTFLINVHMIDNIKDAQDYVSRLASLKVLFGQLIDNLKLREQKGIIAPQFVFPKVIDACGNVIKGAPFDDSKTNSPLWDDFTNKVNKLAISDAEKEKLKRAAKKALLHSVKPAYQNLIGYLGELSKKAPAQGGAWSFPDGDKYYAMAVRQTTTTTLTPEEIYQTGLREVARIQGEIQELMKKVGHGNDSLPAFFNFMRYDHQFFYPNTDAGRAAYLAKATGIIDTMRTRLNDIFITKPKAPIVVMNVEKFRENSAGNGFYEQPSPDGKRPGRFYVNLTDMNQCPIYELEALAYHEGIPGHHMQISIAQELTGIPQFRKYGEYTAYVEGWGLYSEYLPKEMGFYKDTYSDIGRLCMELLRAARLVVDPGLHYKHWTREQGIEYFRRNTAEAPDECVHAIERYIIWPGQATAYKIGMMKILELREKAKRELGPQFNIREFHEVVITNGALPLNVLENLVDEWIVRKKS